MFKNNKKILKIKNENDQKERKKFKFRMIIYL